MHIVFRKVFQKDYMIIFSIIIFLNLSYDSHWMFEVVCGPSGGVWLLACLVIPFFHLPLNVFSITLHIKLGLFHPLVLGVSHCICSQPLDPIGIYLLHCAHGGKRMTSYDVVRNVFECHYKRCKISCLTRVDTCPFHPLPYSFRIIKSTLCY
jgi:hypothetical protein